jgi:hypothetical protein
METGSAPPLRRGPRKSTDFAEGANLDEKRAVLRRRTYFAAKLSSHDGIAWSEGVVRNLSETGALIEALNSPIPDVLDIAIPMAGVRARARVAWRSGARAGLQFQRPPGRADPPPPVACRRDDDPNY